MKKQFLAFTAVVALLSSCTKTTVLTPVPVSLTRTTLNSDTVNFSTPADITYTSRCTEPINTIYLNTSGAIIGTEVNILALTTAGTMLNFTAPTSLKQVILVNGAYSIGATFSTRWLIKLKYFSSNYIEAEITNPQQI